NDGTPGFNDLFTYKPASQKNVTVGTGKTKAVTLKPAINYLKGFVKFTCDIRGVEAGQAVACQPNIDGNPLPPVNPRESAQFAVANGDHNFHVDLVGPNADLWAPPNADKPLKITGNRTTPLTMAFNRKGQLVINTGPQGTVADIFVDDQPIAGQAPTGSIFVAPGSHKVEGRNYNDPAANGVYRWADVKSTGIVGPNQTRTITLNPRKEFLLGFADVTCKINGFEPGRDVRCNVTADGQGLGAIEAGQKQTYNLAPGPHTINVAAVGGNADLWAPAAQDLPVTIIAGRSSLLTPTFNRKGILNITLSDPKVVADIFVDGAQIASRVNSAQAPVAPNTPHVIEARGLVNTAAPDAFEYDPISSKVTVAANQTKVAPLKVGTPREKCTESMAFMQIYNFLRVPMALSFDGPEKFRVRIPTDGNIMVCFLPGTYTIATSAPGFKFKSDTHDIEAGGCYWNKHYRENETPPEVNCSQNHAEYKRPIAFK
ncbi:MAG TPA: hypothetical protein VMP08_16960, partial [Anaerolineae bacterium]|nr:hypothetical protein [Anaerolineae bacterium]